MSTRKAASNAPSALDRITGCILGCAIGDSLGYPVEFWSRAAIVARFGEQAPAGLPVFDHAPRFSDDTQMTLFAIEGLVRALERGSLEDFAGSEVTAAYLRWLESQDEAPSPPPGSVGLLAVDALRVRRAPGTTCMGALEDLDSRASPLHTMSPPNNSKGCGAVMRAAPFGLVTDSVASAFALGCVQGFLTHGHPSGYIAAGAFSAMVHALFRRQSLEQAFAAAEEQVVGVRGHDEVLASMRAAKTAGASRELSPTAIATLGRGWVAEEALAIAVACAFAAETATHNDRAEILWLATCHNGDSDSTAAMAGMLIGVAEGPKAFPAPWRDGVELRETITDLASELHACTERPAAARGFELPTALIEARWLDA
jgi:ADP-ribosylglycohydrolase